MIGTQMIVFESYSDVFGYKVDFEALCKNIQHFSRDSVIYCCVYIGTVLQLWDKAEPSFNGMLLLHNRIFPPWLALRFILKYYSADSEHQRIVFHRRQLLFVCKLAVQLCDSTGIDATIHSRKFGTCLLQANDHLHHGLLSEGKPIDMSPLSITTVLSETLAAGEYSYIQVQNLFVRARLMCLTIAPSLRAHPDYIDIPLAFQERFSLSLATFQHLAFAVAARFGKNLASDLLNRPEHLPMNLSHFVKTDIPGEILTNFLHFVSGTAQLMKGDRSLARKGTSDDATWSGDLTVFRKWPLIQLGEDVLPEGSRPSLLLDHLFLFAKVLSEPYFMGVTISKGFPRFWGAVFEVYVHRFMSSAHEGSGTTYVANPRLSDRPNEELCDGAIVAGSELVLLEYKSAIMTADCKYGGEPETLLAEIRNKFVFDEKDRQPKAVKQLASAVRKLFSTDPVNVLWCDLKRIKRCSVLVVTLDNIGAGMGMSTILDSYFQDELKSFVKLSATINPLFCSDVETLETLSGSFHAQPLSTTLRWWFEANPSRATPLGAMRMPHLIGLRPQWLTDGWETFTIESAKELFNRAVPRRSAADSALTFEFSGSPSKDKE